MPKTALLLIATSPAYHRFIDPLLRSARKFFVGHDPILWTDTPAYAHLAKTFYKQPTGFPNETLFRYHTFLRQEQEWRDYDYVFYSDVDMLFVDHVGEEIFSNGITATMHPGYVNLPGTPETRPESAAYAPKLRQYFAGGFIGGTSKAFLDLAETIAMNINIDAKNGLTAIWHDESHLNRYLYDNPPAKILTPSYCHSEGYVDEFPPKLVALSKAVCRTCGKATKPHVNYCEAHVDNH